MGLPPFHAREERTTRYARWAMGFSLILPALFLEGMKQRSRLLFVLITLMMLVVLPSCGSSSGNHGPPPNPGTPTGTSNGTVTAKSGTTVSTTGFTLIVQ